MFTHKLFQRANNINREGGRAWEVVEEWRRVVEEKRRDEGGGVARMGPTDARRSIATARGTRRN